MSPPFGEEGIIAYASTSPLGDIGQKVEGGVYQVQTKTEDVGIKTRGVRISHKSGGSGPGVSEFNENGATITTKKE